MKVVVVFFLMLITSFSAFAEDQPTRYTELVSYVQEAPDQGETNTCLFVASTGAIELLANKKEGIKNPLPYGKYDLSESFTINAPVYTSRRKYFWEVPVLKYNYGHGVHINDWPYTAWNEGQPSDEPWTYRNWNQMPKVTVPRVQTIPLFVFGDKWSTNVLIQKQIDAIKAALWKYKSPILVNYNDSEFWHVVLIVGYDDNMPGDCYEITKEECGTAGSFYVRDSFGIPVEIRDYDWFRIKGNAAFVVKEVE